MKTQLLDPAAALSWRFVLPEIQEVDPEERQLTRLRLGFRIGGTALLIPPGTLAEVVDLPPIHRLPNTPTWCLGLVNLRGNIAPVFNLHALLDEESKARSHLLILGKGAETVGFLIDGLPFSAELPSSGSTTGRPPLHDLLEPHLGEFWRHQGELLTAFDYRAFLRGLTRMMES